MAEAWLGSAPGRKRAASEEGLGGPFAEVHGEGDAVTVVASEDEHVLAVGMQAEEGAHFFGEENRAAPAVRDAHGGKGRRSEEHTSELQSQSNLVCRLLLDKEPI